MEHNTLIFVGMDTHKEFTEVAYSLDGRDEHSLHHGKIPTTKQAFNTHQLWPGYAH